MNKYLDKAASIAIKPSHAGALHKQLGVPEGEHISDEALTQAKEKAKKSGDAATMRRIVFAQNARKWKHK